MKTTLSIALTILMISIFSCKKELNEKCNEPPIIEKQEFSIIENSAKGTIVDTVKAIDNDKDQILKFNIVGGNINNAFSIDRSTGILHINNSNEIDYEKNPTFELAIEVSDSCSFPLSAVNTITIKLIDQKPSQVGMIAYYNFQGNLQDQINNFDGTSVNVEYFYSTSKQSNQYLFLRGNYNYVKLPDAFDFNEKTINLWFNILDSKTNDWKIIYSSDNPLLKFGMTVLAVTKVEANTLLNFNVSGKQKLVEVEINKWYNVTIVSGNKNYAFYLNGQMVDSGTFDTFIHSSDGHSTATIGCDRTLTRRYFNGLIDDLRIYNRKLDDNEVNVLYNE